MAVIRVRVYKKNQFEYKNRKTKVFNAELNVRLLPGTVVYFCIAFNYVYILPSVEGQKDSRSRIRIRIIEFKYFNPKNLNLSSQKYDPGCSSRIRILGFYRYPSRIPDPRVKKGTGSWIRIRYTVMPEAYRYSTVYDAKNVVTDPDPWERLFRIRPAQKVQDLTGSGFTKLRQND